MKKTKLEKGITLVALIITIVVLLILAVVSIGAVRNSGIIGHATNTSDAWKKAQKEENTYLEGYIEQIESNLPGNWEVLSDGTIKNKVTEETTTIGGEFTNDKVLAATGGTASTYTGTWTVIGVENGKLKLVTTTNAGANVYLGVNDPKAPADGDLEEIFDKAGEETSKDVEKAIWSYQHAEETLNNYAKERTGIESARSITIEDIETVLNITEAKKVELNSSYGRKYNYFYNGTNVQSKYKLREASDTDEWKTSSASSYTSEVFVDKQGNTVVVDSEYKGEGVELDSNDYSYSNAFTDSKFVNSLGTGYYWLASPCVDCRTGYAFFDVRYVFSGSIRDYRLFNSDGDADSFSWRSPCRSLHLKSNVNQNCRIMWNAERRLTNQRFTYII